MYLISFEYNVTMSDEKTLNALQAEDSYIATKWNGISSANGFHQLRYDQGENLFLMSRMCNFLTFTSEQLSTMFLSDFLATITLAFFPTGFVSFYV